MLKKSRMLTFSTILLIINTLSVHAMEQDKPVRRQSRVKLQPGEISEKYRKYNCPPIQKKIITLNEFGVTPDEFEDVVSFYSNHFNQGNFTTLCALFTKIPVEKRNDALKDLEQKINSRGFRPMFSKYEFLPNGIVIDSPVKPKNAVNLKDWLLQLPYEPGEY